MKNELILYTRKDCCLCEEMKITIRQVAERFPLAIRELDVDISQDLQQQYGNEVPVLFVNGRKAFKYRVTAKALESRLKKDALV
jgi:thiol-disulfide isomerase/thioredoxin